MPYTAISLGSNILEIHQRSGDADLAQTLIRLAQLAAADHQHEMTMQVQRKVQADLQVHKPGTDVGEHHKEVMT